MPCSYSTIAWSASLHKGVQKDVHYGYTTKSTAGEVFNFFSALGVVAFVYAGHSVALPLFTRDCIRMSIMVTVIGFWVFGNQVEDNILVTLEKPIWLIAMANMFVVVHVIGSYQIYAMPVFDMIEIVLVKKLKFTPTRTLRFVTRNVYVGK
ncbi:hypothetical protein U1Q18_018083 [Sarracenia purpurea var. burkii]